MRCFNQALLAESNLDFKSIRLVGFETIGLATGAELAPSSGLRYWASLAAKLRSSSGVLLGKLDESGAAPMTKGGGAISFGFFAPSADFVGELLDLATARARKTKTKERAEEVMAK